MFESVPRFRWLTLWLMFGVSLLTASASGTAYAQQQQPILVGEYGSFTGPEATFGQSTHKGIMLAVEERNAAGGVNGRPIEIKHYDDQGKSQEASTAVTRLITSDRVVAVLGEVASGLSLAGAPIAQRHGVPMITPASTNVRVTRVGDMIFRVCFVDSFQGYVVSKFAYDELGARRIAILYDQKQAYSKGLKDDFAAAFTDLGGEITTEQAYSGGDQDFNAQLTTIRNTNPDAIFIPGYYTDVGNIVLQARRLGIQAPLLGGDGWDSTRLTEVAGAALDGCYYSNHYAPEEDRPKVREFVEKFTQTYGEQPDAMAALGYDAAHILFEAMARAPSLGGRDLAKAIGETADFEGVTGTITINEQRNATKSAVILAFQDGKPRHRATIAPPEGE